MNILNNITFTYKVADDQNNLFTSSHRKYKCTIKYNNKQFTSDYQCNIKSVPIKEDFIYCIYMDSTACDLCGSDVWGFANEYGYSINCKDDYKKVQKIVNACKKNSNAMHRLFNDAELEEIAEIMQEY